MPLDDDLLTRIRDGAIARERDRELPRDLVRELVAGGFAAARVPARAGGEGVSLEELFRRLIELATADSNVAHVFRGHLGFVEQLRFEPDAEHRDRWYRRVLDGALVGNAQSELTGTSDLATTLRRDGDRLLLTGRKYYTTGSIYSDWIDLGARFGDDDSRVIVSTDQPGVRSVDDWAGFGQKLTGSGTTTFTDAQVDPADVRPYADHGPVHGSTTSAFFQLVLLSVVAGIARGAVDATVEFVRPRTRIFGYAGTALPRDNALVQGVVGELSSVAFAARAAVLEAARGLDAVHAAVDAGEDPVEQARAAELDVFRAQQVVLRQVIAATGELFEVGGASAVDAGLALDRFWRNARTIATHNPAIHRRRAIGAWELNGTPPEWNISAPPIAHPEDGAGA